MIFARWASLVLTNSNCNKILPISLQILQKVICKLTLNLTKNASDWQKITPHREITCREQVWELLWANAIYKKRDDWMNMWVLYKGILLSCDDRKNLSYFKIQVYLILHLENTTTSTQVNYSSEKNSRWLYSCIY